MKLLKWLCLFVFLPSSFLIASSVPLFCIRVLREVVRSGEMLALLPAANVTVHVHGKEPRLMTYIGKITLKGKKQLVVLDEKMNQYIIPENNPRYVILQAEDIVPVVPEFQEVVHIKAQNGETCLAHALVNCIRQYDIHHPDIVNSIRFNPDFDAAVKMLYQPQVLNQAARSYDDAIAVIHTQLELTSKSLIQAGIDVTRSESVSDLVASLEHGPAVLPVYFKVRGNDRKTYNWQAIEDGQLLQNVSSVEDVGVLLSRSVAEQLLREEFSSEKSDDLEDSFFDLFIKPDFGRHAVVAIGVVKGGPNNNKIIIADSNVGGYWLAKPEDIQNALTAPMILTKPRSNLSFPVPSP